MQIKTKAIVFHSFKCNDNRIIVDFHILDCGRLSVAVTVSNSRKTKFRKTLLSQLTLLYRARCAPAGRTEDSHRRQLNSMTKRVDGFFIRNSLCQLFNCPVNVVVLVCHPLAEVGISPVYALSLVWPYPLTGFCRSTYRDAQWGLTAVVGCGTDGV